MRPSPRRAFSLPELVLTSTLVALVAALAVPRTGAALDRIRLTQAGGEVAEALAVGRAAAIARSAYVRVVVDETAGALRVETDDGTLRSRDLRGLHRVALRATRDTVTYAPTGLGYGLANTTIVVARGARAETVTVSRLGRVRTSW
jgi:prepilin-type N-terminal cleavage/methylation domain-containing protein